MSNKRSMRVFIVPSTFDEMANPDALSVDVVLFKRGGSQGREEAIPVIITEV